MQSHDGLSGTFSDPDDVAAQPQGVTPPSIDELRRMYREAFSSQDSARRDAEKAVDYYHGPGQLSPAIRAEMAARRQPAVFDNIIGPAVNGVLGLLDSGETDPEAYGREEDDEEAATLATKVLRYQATVSDLADVKRDVSFDLMVPGIGAAIVEVKPNGDSRVSAIPFNEFFYDPYSRRHDFQDARYLGRAKWVDSAQARRNFPEKMAELGNPFSGAFEGVGPEDKPAFQAIWLDASRRRLLLVDLYYEDDQTGEWMRATFCHAGILDFGTSGYVDDEGNAICPIVATSFQVDRDNNRYGMVLNMISLQDSVNARMSRMLHITNSAQVEMAEGANPTEKDIARREAARADGILPAGYKKLSMVDTFQGNHQIMLNDKEALERKAPSPALLGRAGGANESGRARQVLQQAGMSELARAFSRWESWERRIFIQMWYRSQQFMTDARRIRITNQAGAQEALQINVPVVQHRPMPVLDPETGQPIIDPQTGQPQMQMQMQAVQVGVENEIAKLNMDINIKTVRQVDTLREEAFNSVLNLAAKAGISPIDPAFEMLIEMAPNIPDKTALLDKFHRIRAKAAEEAAPAQQMQQQMAQQSQAIAAAATQSKTQRDQAQAERDHALANKHAVEADADAFELAMRKALADHGVHPDNLFPDL